MVGALGRPLVVSSAMLTLVGCQLVFPYGASSRDGGSAADGPLDSAVVDQRRAEAGGDDWWQQSWPFRKRLVAAPAAGATDLVEFVLLVSLASDVDLAAHVESANELRFVADDGVTVLAHDIERFDGTTGALTAWVRLPALRAGSATTLYLYFGNPAAGAAAPAEQVWLGSDVVLHCGSDGDTATAARNAADPAASAASSGAAPVGEGKIAGAIAFDAPDDSVLPANGAALLDGWSTFHVSFWFYLDYASDAAWVLDNEAKVIEKWDALSSGRTFHRTFDGPGQGAFQVDVVLEGAGYQYINGGIRRQAWTQVALDYDGDKLVLYIDGAPQSDTVAPGDRLASSTNALTLGGSVFGWRSFKGKLDELRVGRVSRGAAWIAAEHANQAAPATFVGVGPLEGAPPTPGVEG